MKRLLVPVFAICSFFLVGCLETTQEITLNEDGSGTVTNTNDLSALIGLAKQMGAGAEMEKSPVSVMDSSFTMKEGADSIPNLSLEEREMIRTATMRIKANMKEEKFLTLITIPFKNPGQIVPANKASAKAMAEAMKEQMKEGQGAAVPMDQLPEQSSFDDYYKYEFSNGELTRKVDNDKYAGVESDEYFKGLKQAAAMGLEMKATYIINLPRPAQKAEGKKLKLSEDKKSISITGTLDEFLADASVFEFKIKY